MKARVLLLVVLFGVWLWRRGRTLQTPPVPPVPPAPRVSPPAQPMVSCTRCGVHLPQSLAVRGRQGDYCCEAHRREAEGG